MTETMQQPTTETQTTPGAFVPGAEPIPTGQPTENGEDTETTETTETAAGENAYAKIKTFDDMPTRSYFAPAERDQLVQYIERMEQLRPADISVIQYDGQISEDATLVVTKLSESRDVVEDGKQVKRRLTSAVVVWPIPSLAGFLATAKGNEFVVSAVHAAAVAEIIKPLRGKSNEDRAEVTEQIPVNVADFAASGREGVMKIINDLLKQLLSKMKKDQPKNKFLKTCSIAMLRQCMTNASLAMQFAPKLETQGVFEAWLRGIKATMETAGKNATEIDNWLAQRNEPEEEDEDEDGAFDFSNLSEVLKVE